MNDDLQDQVPVEKEYWHDRRLEAASAAAALASSSVGIHPTREDDSAAAAVLSPFRTSRALRHPIASFFVTVILVIMLGVCLLAATGGGALAVPPVRLANCAQPTVALLGAPGAQFTAAFPSGVRAPLLGPATNDSCFYGFSETDGDSARPLSFTISATYGQVRLPGFDGAVGMVPYWWVRPSDLRRVFLEGASGLEAFRCEEATDWCYGWLRVSRGRVTWVVTGTGNGTRLPTIEAFLQSFQPAPRAGPAAADYQCPSSLRAGGRPLQARSRTLA